MDIESPAQAGRCEPDTYGLPCQSEQGWHKHLIESRLDRAARLFCSLLPWTLAAFLAGLLVMGWRAEIKLEKQYITRIEEANLRLDLLEEALSVATATKFHAADAKREAVRRKNKEEKQR